MKFKSSFIFIFWFFLQGFIGISVPVSGQSFAYKTLLSTLYDADFNTIKPEEIKELSAYQILDTREKDEYEVSHLAEANWVGYETFTIENVSNIDKDKPVLVYCTVGARSQDIGQKLKRAGFSQVYNLYGGIIQWSNDEMPLYKNNLPTTQVHTYSQTWGIWLNKGVKVY